MPERDVSFVALQTSAYITGLSLSGWAVLGVILSLTDRTQIGATVVGIGLSHWVVPSILLCTALLEIWGHAAHSRHILIAGDLIGGAACSTAACVMAYATIHGSNGCISALNWSFIGLQFLIHTIMLHQKQVTES